MAASQQLSELAPQDAAHAVNQRIVLAAIALIAVFGVIGAFVCVFTHTAIPDQLWALVATDVGVLSGMLINTRPGAGQTTAVVPGNDVPGVLDDDAGDSTVTQMGEAPRTMTGGSRRPQPTPHR